MKTNLREQLDKFPGGQPFDLEDDPLADLPTEVRNLVDFFVAELFTRDQPDPRCVLDWN